MAFEDDVNQAISNVTKSDDGNLSFPEGTSEAVQYAAISEIRRRDTQSALDISKQEAKALETENNKLAETWEQEVSSTLTSEQAAELEELKVQDPEAWRQKINEYEAQNKEKVRERRKEITKASSQETELERRARVLEEHNLANPDHQLDDDVITNDIPPRITKKLESGDITFDEFLKEASDYLAKGKVIGSGDKDTVEDEPNLNDMGGSNLPTADNIEADIIESYKTEIY